MQQMYFLQVYAICCPCLFMLKWWPLMANKDQELVVNYNLATISAESCIVNACI